MTIEEYLIALIKRWRLMVSCIVLLGVGAFIGSRLMTPVYQSAAVVQVVFSSSNNQSAYYSLLAGNQIIQTEAALATSDPVIREVASHYPGLTADELSRKVTATPKANTQLFEIDVQDSSPTRAATLANDIANTLIQQQFQLAQQASAQTNNFLVIAQLARPPLKPIIPNTRLTIGIGLLAGLLLGMALVLLFEQISPPVRTPEALIQLVDWPILGTILQAGPREEVVNVTGRNANAESYHILRTNIGFSAIEKPLHTLIVTSASLHDGKSVTAANLAIFMARGGKSTLLVDADLRCPSLHEMFGLPALTMGFSNAILAFSTLPAPSGASAATRTPSLNSFVHAVDDIPNLYIMPSGPLPPNPPELLDSKAMQRLLKALDGLGVEMVIFDTPPLLGLSDARILASKANGTLVVIDITRAKKEDLKQMKAILERAGADVLGCVVNKQQRSRYQAMYSSYSAYEQTGGNSNSRKNGRLASGTQDILNEPKIETQQDLLDITMKMAPIRPMEIDTQHQLNSSEE